MIYIALVILVAVVMMNILIPSPPPPPVTVEEWEFLDKIGNMAKRGWHSIADPISKEVSDLGKKAKGARGGHLRRPDQPDRPWHRKRR